MAHSYFWGGCKLELQAGASDGVNWSLRYSGYRVVSLSTGVTFFKGLLQSILRSP